MIWKSSASCRGDKLSRRPGKSIASNGARCVSASIVYNRQRDVRMKSTKLARKLAQKEEAREGDMHAKNGQDHSGLRNVN